MILSTDIKYSSYHKQNFQNLQRNSNDSYPKSKNIQNGVPKCLINKNITFGMAAIKPKKTRNIVSNILKGLAKVLSPETKAKDIKKVDNLADKAITKVPDNRLNFGETMKKADSLLEDKNLKNFSENESIGENIIKQPEKQVDIETPKNVLNTDTTKIDKYANPNYLEEYNYFKKLAENASSNDKVHVSYYDSGSLKFVSVHGDETNKNTKLAFFYKNGGLKFVVEHNPKTGRELKNIAFYEDGALKSVKYYDPITEKQLKGIAYQADGKTMNLEEDYDPTTGYLLKETHYLPDCKGIKKINKFVPQKRGWLEQVIYYQADGKTLERIVDYDPTSYNSIKKDTYYHQDGINIKRLIENNYAPGKDWHKKQTDYQLNDSSNQKIKEMFFCFEIIPTRTIEYNPNNGYKTKEVEYYRGKIESIYDYSLKTGKLLKKTFYPMGDKAFSSITDFDPNTGKKIKLTCYQMDGETISSVTLYNLEQNGKYVTKKIMYSEDGKSIDCVDEIDHDTNKMLKRTIYQKDGKTINAVVWWSSYRNFPTKRVYYHTDGKTEKRIVTLDPKTLALINDTEYYEDGVTVKRIAQEQSDKAIVKEIHYKADGKTEKCIIEYDITNDRILRQIDYPNDGKNIKIITEYDYGKISEEAKKLFEKYHGKFYRPSMSENIKQKQTYYQKDGEVVREIFVDKARRYSIS